MLATALIGFAFGFLGSIPLAGPIAVLVFSRALEGRFRGGLGIAIGAALAESIYAFLAYFGFATWLEAWPGLVTASRALAAVILAALGVVFLRGVERRGPAHVEAGWRREMALGFGLTALNPTLLATWAAASAVLLSTGWVTFERSLAPVFAGSAALGIAAWFALLLALMRRWGSALRASTIRRVTRAMGVMLLGISAWLGLRLLFG